MVGFVICALQICTSVQAPLEDEPMLKLIVFGNFLVIGGGLWKIYCSRTNCLKFLPLNCIKSQFNNFILGQRPAGVVAEAREVQEEAYRRDGVSDDKRKEMLQPG